MTINDIKIEALKLMFTNYSEDISDVAELTNDDNYSAYIMSMNGAINRAVARLRAKRVIRQPFKLLPQSFADLDNGLELSEAITPDVDASVIEAEVIAENPNATAEDIAEAIAEAEAKARVSIPDDVQPMIAYYIKADLFEEDEPSLSALARNVFETFIDDRQYDETQDSIVNVYRRGWLQ